MTGSIPPADHHRDVTGGWLRPAVFGAMDGLVSNFALMAGVAGAAAATGGGQKNVILAGLAGLAAGAFSMAAGEYVSVASQSELAEQEFENERLELRRNAEGEAKELAQIWVRRGVDLELAEAVAEQLGRNPEAALEVHAREELGLAPGELKLSGAILASIYLGEIKKWNDPQIAAINPGAKLPNLPITVVHRSDGSGTSFIYTTYLSIKSPAWASKVGANDAVEWPVGLGGKGNDGVAAFVKQTIGSIGYVEYAFALQNKMTHVSMQNKAGAFVQPTAPNFAAAAARADWAHAPGYYLILVDQAGPTTWPIVGATFILMHKAQANAANGQSVLKFFDWAYKNGDAMAGQLDYIPLPAAVKTQIRATWTANIKGPNGAPVYMP